MRAALERVQGTLQCIGHWLWKTLRAVSQEIDQRAEMRFRLVAENFQQLRIQHIVASSLLLHRQ